MACQHTVVCGKADFQVKSVISLRFLTIESKITDKFTQLHNDSGFMKYFAEYLINYERDVEYAIDEIYKRFIFMIDGNIPTHSVLDIKRIFHKIFNVLACANGVPGSL